MGQSQSSLTGNQKSTVWDELNNKIDVAENKITLTAKDITNAKVKLDQAERSKDASAIGFCREMLLKLQDEKNKLQDDKNKLQDEKLELQKQETARIIESGKQKSTRQSKSSSDKNDTTIQNSLL